MSRSIIEVIDKIRTVVPEEEAVIHAKLEQTRLSALYTPPESMRDRWVMLSLCFKSCPNPPETDWQKEVSAILKEKS